MENRFHPQLIWPSIMSEDFSAQKQIKRCDDYYIKTRIFKLAVTQGKRDSVIFTF